MQYKATLWFKRKIINWIQAKQVWCDRNSCSEFNKTVCSNNVWIKYNNGWYLCSCWPLIKRRMTFSKHWKWSVHNCTCTSYEIRMEKVNIDDPKASTNHFISTVHPFEIVIEPSFRHTSFRRYFNENVAIHVEYGQSVVWRTASKLCVLSDDFVENILSHLTPYLVAFEHFERVISRWKRLLIRMDKKISMFQLNRIQRLWLHPYIHLSQSHYKCDNNISTVATIVWLHLAVISPKCQSIMTLSTWMQ